MKTAVITGGSSGIGKATVEKFAQSGYRVFELSRSGKSYGGVTHIGCDVTDSENVGAVFAEISQSGPVDVLVCCAGNGISGAVEFIGKEDVEKQFEVNFFGMTNCVRSVLPYMRENGGGRIIVISSVAAVCPIPFQVYYSASKAAVNSFVCGLANEVRKFGISVSCIMPGDIKTGFTSARHKIHTGDDIYGGSISKSVEVMEKDEQNGMSPDCVAGLALKLAAKKKAAPIYTAGVSYKFLAFLAKILPCRLTNSLIGKIYVK